MAPNPTTIFHITDIANLPSILENRGLLSYSLMIQNSIGYINIAHNTIQERRAKKAVPIHPYGFLHDYVPFYFAPRSPMLYTISRGNVEGYKGGQRSVLHLYTSAQRISQSGLHYCFTDGHAVIALSNYFRDLQFLDEIDWSVMDSRYWFDTLESPDRTRTRQAEFLVNNNRPLGTD
ncbi:MAG: DUF4433 domain-containing protein [Desulfitobacterium hafniense]|nr:DUF4433 domain-containing protein [Desulfitobacterium hafniense]